MKKTHLLLMLALCATLLASCSAGEPDVTQTQPVPSISPTNTPDENTVLPGLDDDIILPDGGMNDSTTREATGVTSMDKARRVIEQLEEELERLSEVKEAHVIIAGHKAAVALTFDDQYKAGIDDRFRKIVRERINEMDVNETEKLIFQVMDKELKAIVWLGALLGLLMGSINILIYP